MSNAVSPCTFPWYMQGSISSASKPIERIESLKRFNQCSDASRSPLSARKRSRYAGEPSISDTDRGNLRTMTRPHGKGECIKACETSRAFKRKERLDANERMKCKPSMLGVGLEIPNFLAETPRLMSFATILTRTLVSLLYAETHLLGIIRIPGFFFFNASTSACPITFPAPHFSKLAISSFIPSKPRSALSCINELSSITSSGFQTKTSEPPSFTFVQVWSRSGMNLIEFNSSSNNSGLVATGRSGPASIDHKTGPRD